MSLAVLGIGTAVPATRLSQEESETITRIIACLDADRAASLHALYRQSGVAHRHICIAREVVDDVFAGTEHTGSPFLPKRRLNEQGEDHGPTTRERMDHYETAALPLAEAASRQALADSGLRPTDITHLVTVSCTGFAAPGFDIGLIKRLGLPNTTERTHVGFMGCHGGMNGLRTAAAFTGADPSARVLLCCVELCSLHFHYVWDPKRLVANALFADGASALVGVPESVADGGAWVRRASGSCLFPDSESAMTWNIGDHGFDMTLSSRVPNLLRAGLRPWLEGWLRRHGLRIEDVATWAIHPGGPRVLTDLEAALGLPEGTTAVSREVLSECGNMSSATVLFVLRRLLQRRAPAPCVALGFGPGLVAEAALFV